MDKSVAKYPDIKVTKNEVRIPGYFEDGAQYANAWLASHPAGSENLAIWGCWDDPSIGAIGSLRAQDRDDVKVYGVNGNAQALENIKNGFMTATAWQDSYHRGLQHGQDAEGDQRRRQGLDAEGCRGAGRARHQGNCRSDSSQIIRTRSSNAMAY